MGFLRKTSGKGKLGAAGAALVAVIAGMVALAAPASAHHSEISASARCVTGDGVWRVSWTASTWSTSETEGGHPGILVEYRVDGGAWTTVPNDSSAMPYSDTSLTPIQGVGVFRGSAIPSFTGTIDFAPSAVDQVIQVRSRPLSAVPSSGALAGPWYWDDNFIPPSDAGTALDTKAAGAALTWRNGNTSADGRTTNNITLKGGECQPPAEPAAELKSECATKDGVTGIEILLTNTGGTAATFTVEGVGGTFNVPAGGSTTVFVPVAEDAAYSIDVTVGGEPVEGSPIEGTRDCLTPNPSAELKAECATNQAGATGIEIRLVNTGTQSASFTVEGLEGTYHVGAGGNTVVFVPVAEDAAYSIDVRVGGEHVPGSPIAGTRDCLTPEPSAALADECAVDDDVEGIEITLTNDGDQGVTINVEGIGDVFVGPDSSTTVFVPVAENSSYSIDVIALGGHVPGSPIDGTRDCRSPEPSAALEDECAELRGIEGVSITLTNTGDEDATFQVDGGDDVVVEAGGSKTVFVQVDENSDYSIEVTSGGETIATIEGTRDCRHPEPGAELDDECAVEGETEGVAIKLTNTGDDDATFQVDGGDDIVVAAGESTTVFVPVDENTDYSIEVTSGGETVATIEGHRDCRQGVGGASVENECAVDGETEGVAIKLTNTGDDDATFQVDGGGDIVVAAGESTTVFVPVDENSDYSITVTSGGQTLATFEGTRDCRHGVAGVSIAEVCAIDEGGAEGILLTLTNTGDDDVDFQVDGGFDITVAAGASEDVFVEVAENSDYSITVTSDGQTVATLEGTRDCRQPAYDAELSIDCSVVDGIEGLTITLINTGDDVAYFSVDGGEDIEVPAGSTVDVFVPVDEDTAYSIEVTVGGEVLPVAVGDAIATFEGVRDCRAADPSASIVECAESDGETGVLITLTNDGDQEATFQVDGGEDVVVPAESETTVFVPVAEDEAYSVEVTADGETLITFEGTRDCDEPETTTTTRPVEVGGVQNPQPLPRTGSESSRSLVVGLALLISGAGVVLLAADRRRAASR